MDRSEAPTTLWGAKKHLESREIHLVLGSTPLTAGGAAWGQQQGRGHSTTGSQAGWWSLAGPNSPVLAVLSIPTRTLPPSPPLRLLCAEAAFRGLVLQGGERARKGRLMPAEPRGDTTGTEEESVGVREGRGKDRDSTWKRKKKQSQY